MCAATRSIRAIKKQNTLLKQEMHIVARFLDDPSLKEQRRVMWSPSQKLLNEMVTAQTRPQCPSFHVAPKQGNEARLTGGREYSGAKSIAEWSVACYEAGRSPVETRSCSNKETKPRLGLLAVTSEMTSRSPFSLVDRHDVRRSIVKVVQVQ